MSTQSKPGILAFVDRYDQESVQALRHDGAEFTFMRAFTVYMGGYPPSPILIAVGPVGGEKLCQHIADWGLDGVRSIGLVGVTAPWCDWASPKSLGPLETLRKAAEMARNTTCEKWRYDTHELCTQPATHILDHAFMPKAQRVCTKHGEGEWNDSVLKPFVPIRLVIACSPDDGVCGTCKGRGRQGSAWDTEGSYDCPTCDGTGKALSSADVARELTGIEPGRQTDDIAFPCGWIVNFAAKRLLDEHGIRAALELAVKE